MTNIAKIIAGVVWLFKWIVTRITRKQDQDYGRLKAEEEGREHVQDIRDKLHDVDTGSVSNDEVIRRD